MDEVGAIVASLRGSQDWNAVLDQLDAWSQSPSHLPLIKRLHQKILAVPNDARQPSFVSVRHHIESVLALSEEAECVELAWGILRAHRAAGGKESHLPAMLAQAHAWPKIRRLLETHRASPRPLEIEVRCQTFSVRGWSWANPDPKPLTRAANGPAPELSFDALSPEARQAIGGAFDGLCTRSNGRLALRAFSARAELRATRGLVQAISSDFEPLTGAVAFVTGPIRAESAVAAVLGAPILGGAYGGALGGCFGRLAGWPVPSPGKKERHCHHLDGYRLKLATRPRRGRW